MKKRKCGKMENGNLLRSSGVEWREEEAEGSEEEKNLSRDKHFLKTGKERGGGRKKILDLRLLF